MGEDNLISCSKNTTIAILLLLMATTETIFLMYGFYAVYKNMNLVSDKENVKLWGYVLYNCLSGIFIVLHNLYTSLNLTCSTKTNDNNFLRYFLSVFRLATFITGTILLVSKNYSDTNNYQLIWNSFQQYYCYATIILVVNIASLFLSLYLNCTETRKKLIVDENGLTKTIEYNRMINNL